MQTRDRRLADTLGERFLLVPAVPAKTFSSPPHLHSPRHSILEQG